MPRFVAMNPKLWKIGSFADNEKPDCPTMKCIAENWGAFAGNFQWNWHHQHLAGCDKQATQRQGLDFRKAKQICRWKQLVLQKPERGKFHCLLDWQKIEDRWMAVARL